MFQLVDPLTPTSIQNIYEIDIFLTADNGNFN